MRVTIYQEPGNKDSIIGWVDDSADCENSHCQHHIREGRPLHGISRLARTRLPRTHFSTWDEAINAIKEANA